MKKPVIDYREFRLSKINTPKFSHLKLLLGWVVYLTFFFLTERFIPQERCNLVYSPLDDIIPFCEWFIIPYVFWYFLLVFTILYFLLYNIETFKQFQIYIIITQIVAVTVFVVFPTMQDLRPEVMPRDNALTDIISFLYTIDTPTGVCPSLHVAYSLGIASVWTKEKGVHLWFKLFVSLWVVLICLSTVFIKQHSVVDIFAAVILCLVAEAIVYRKKYINFFT